MESVKYRLLSALFSICLCFWPGIKAAAAILEIPVMTQNLYLGADAGPVLSNPTPATIQAAFDSVRANNFSARAVAIASEAAYAGGPLRIGLQEAEIISARLLPLSGADVTVKPLGRAPGEAPGSCWPAPAEPDADPLAVLRRRIEQQPLLGPMRRCNKHGTL